MIASDLFKEQVSLGGFAGFAAAEDKGYLGLDFALLDFALKE